MPHDPGAVLGFLQDVYLCQAVLATDGMKPGPLVVQSSEGIGRTGTFIAIDILVHLIAFQGESVFCVCAHVCGFVCECTCRVYWRNTLHPVNL